MTQRVTLANPRVIRAIQSDFIATYYNFDRPGFEVEPLEGMEESATDWDASCLDPGYGSGQVTFFVCGPDRLILHRIDGFIPADLLLDELTWTMKLESARRTHGESSRDGIQALVEARQRDEKDKREQLAKLDRRDSTALVAATYRCRILDELAHDYLLRRPEPFLLGVLKPSTGRGEP